MFVWRIAWYGYQHATPSAYISADTQLKDFNRELMASNKKSREDFDRCQKELKSQEKAIAKHAEAIARHEPESLDNFIDLLDFEGTLMIDECIFYRANK